MSTTERYSMNSRWTISPEIYKRITTKFKENKTKFSRMDFLDLAKKYDKNISVVTRILANLEEKNKIAVVGESQTSGGGWKYKIYQVISGADFTDKYEPDYRARIVNVEKHNTECALRLHKALNKVTRMNLRA